MSSQRQPNSTYLDPGVVFEGKYRIVRELGRGGFGMVYLAYQQKMDRHVAIKVLKSGAGDLHHSAKERFLREVKIISKLRHPNTVTIHDFGETGRGVLYMVLEYIEGDTVKEILKRQGAQSPQRALALGGQIARSLAEAHRYGVIHRDLKPANIMVTDLETESDFVKVLDFGIARLLRTDERDLTSVGLPDGERELIGTPRYMSPEQVRGESLGPASDVYSVGLILYEMLVGEPAVQGDTTMALISQQISREPLRLAGLRALDPNIADLIRRATAKALSDRFVNAENLIDGIDQALVAAGGPLPGSASARQSGRFPAIDASSQRTGGANQRHQGPGRANQFGAGFGAGAGAVAGWNAASQQQGKQSPQRPQQQNSNQQPPATQRQGEQWGASQQTGAAPTQAGRSERPPGFMSNDISEYRDDFTMGLGDELPPPPGDTNPFAVPEPTPPPTSRTSSQRLGEPEQDTSTDFVVEFLRMGLFGLVAGIGLYVAFLVVSTIFGQFLSGQLKLIATLILAAAIPLLTALGENSKRERFEVVDNPYDRIVRVFVGTAIFSFGTAVLCTLVMSGAVVHELRTYPNWFMTDSQRNSAAGELNYKVSLGLAQVVEEATTAIGIYSGKPHGDTGPTQPKQPAQPAVPEPTRPSTRAKQQQQPPADNPADDGQQNNRAAPDKPPEEAPNKQRDGDDEYIDW
ncbi:MAG: serine/threonine protein kinase [Persicimonas sp.]